MEFNSQLALYQALIPVFNVKKRLLSNMGNNVTNEDIWKHLATTKWKYSHNLTISEIVNDIIMFDVSKLEGAK